MPRYKLTIEYDGTPFVGWQRQANGHSVQQALEAALQRFSSESAVITGAGRTDAGVHATGQVGHVDLSYNWRSDEIRDAMNFHLRPHPISVVRVEAVSDDFQARFSAIRRHYVYRILNRRAPAALQRNCVWHIARALNADAMHKAAQQLLGHHDFSTFRASECQANSPMRTLERLDVVRTGDIIEIHASARSFLHHQVRSMVGCLKLVGTGTWDASRLAAALAARDRAALGLNAPAQGLYFVAATYPDSREESQ
jgi:tRNA pseudouridine38-40 synthase